MVLIAASPIAPPICRLVFTSPEATPASARSTPARLAIVTGTKEKPSPVAAEHEGREEIPEVVAVHRHLREQADRDRGEREARHERRPDADPRDHRLREVRGDDDRQGEGDERDAALHGRVVEDVLHVEREDEELRERDGSDERHRHVRGRQRAQAEDPQRQERRARARLDRRRTPR